VEPHQDQVRLLECVGDFIAEDKEGASIEVISKSIEGAGAHVKYKKSGK
jgi:hypothetical protein